MKKIEGCIDVTDKWLKNTISNNYNVLDKKEYKVNGVNYKVDGKHVVLDYSQREKNIAKVLARILGEEIFMLPRINFPQGISTPDFLIKGKEFDLKEPKGKSEKLLYNMLSKKSKQANNFVFNISVCPINIEEIVRQAKEIYKSSHTKFIDIIILFKDDKIIKVFKRK